MKKSHPIQFFGLLVLACASYLVLRPATPEADPEQSVQTIEKQANLVTYNRQQAPSLDVDADGNVLVAWGSRRQEAGSFGVFGRLLDANGDHVGGEIHINQHMANNQEAPAVAFGPSGDAWVTWQSHDQDGSGGSVVARRFGREGTTFTALGDEFIVNERTAGDQMQPSVTVGADRAMVVWSTVEAGRQVVSGRIFDADGAPLTGESRLSDSTDLHEWMPTVSAQPDGRFVAAWAARADDGTPVGVFGRRIDAEGAPTGDTMALGTGGIEPSLDADATGAFVLAWMRTSDAGGYDVFTRRFDAEGSPITGTIRTADVAGLGEQGWLSGAAVATAADGRFVVAYNVDREMEASGQQGEPTTTSNVVAQRYDADGTPRGDAFQVNVETEGRQALSIANVRRVAWGADDRVAFAWNGNTGDDGKGVGVTMLVNETRREIASGLGVDERILAHEGVMYELPADQQALLEIVPPEFDPNFVPEPWDKPRLSPGGDFGFLGIQNTGWNPPDPDLAVGTNHVLVAANGQIRAYTKAGSLLWARLMSGSGGFWGPLGGGGFIFDPVELWDPHSGRFVLVCTEHVGSTDYLVFAVSKSDDISTWDTSWHKYRWNLNSLCGFIDFPDLGVDDEAIYVTTDCFNSPGGNKAWIIDKSEVLNGQSSFPTRVQTSSGFLSLGAVKTYDADAPAQYFASAQGGTSTSIQLQAIRNPLGSPIRNTFNLPVSFYSNPPGAQQLGSSNRVATIDRRIKNGVYRNGRLWLSHTISNGGVARVRWYEVDMRGWPSSGNNPLLLQEGNLDLGSGVHTWFPDIDVDAFGNAGISFNRSSSSEYVSIQRSYRLVGDPPNTMQTPVTLQTSTSAELGSRWGDYGGVHQDPVDTNAFWGAHEYRTTSWRVWVGRWEVPVVNPCPEDLDGSGAVDFGDILAILSAWDNSGGPEDLDGSGAVDFGDILEVLGDLGAVPVTRRRRQA